MVSPVFRNPDSNVQVTIQTLLIGYFLTQGMAFGAI